MLKLLTKNFLSVLALTHTREKRVLASSYLSVCTHVSVFDIPNVKKNALLKSVSRAHPGSGGGGSRAAAHPPPPPNGNLKITDTMIPTVLSSLTFSQNKPLNTSDDSTLR